MLFWYVCGICFLVQAEKVLVYDEEKGIIFVDKDAPKTASVPKAAPRSALPEKKSPEPTSMQLKKVVAPADRHDIQEGRKKDPSATYLKSGLDYFTAGDFGNALKNFMHADSLESKPEYLLWIGKTYRQLGESEHMMFTMQNIFNVYPESDVADDALFEIAFYYQTAGNYDTASILYIKLAEQFPFGMSYSNGEGFREVAKKQRQAMRSEMISNLNILGFSGDDLPGLYKQFQGKFDLLQTGTGNAETIKRIKQEFEEQNEAEDRAQQQKEQRAKLLKWILLGNGVAFLLLCGIVIQMISMRNKQKTFLQSLLLLRDLSVKNL